MKKQKRMGATHDLSRLHTINEETKKKDGHFLITSRTKSGPEALRGNFIFFSCDNYPGGFQKPDPTVAKARKRLVARFYQLKAGHCLTGQYLAWTTRRPDASCWCQYHTPPDLGSPAQTLPRMEEPAENTMEHRLSRDPQAHRTHPGAAKNQHRGTVRRSAVRTQTLAERQVHRWQRRRAKRPARPRSGRKERGRRGWLR